MEDISIRELNKAELFQKFMAQLHKDYEMCGVEHFLPVITNHDLHDIHVAMTRSVDEMSRSTSSSFLNFLYRIDISESQIQKAISAQAQSDPHAVIAELIIKRILQKVILKQLYSK